jgi:hypothetical protein
VEQSAILSQLFFLVQQVLIGELFQKSKNYKLNTIQKRSSHELKGEPFTSVGLYKRIVEPFRIIHKTNQVHS